MVALLVVLGLTFGLGVVDAEGALVLCKRKQRIAIREDACKRKETQLDPAGFGVAGPAGAPGAPGAPGADGQLRIYGDGSAGARTVAADETLDDENLQYTDFTVAKGATLTVPSGTVIRCTGTFTNDGTIQVALGTHGSERRWRSENIDGSYAEAHPGVSSWAAGGGETGPAGTFYSGSPGGRGISAIAARALLRPGANAGGSGGGAGFGGADGGGALTVLAVAAILNAGTIQANGAVGSSPGSGGGGGGIVVLASKSAVTNQGTMTATGGAGGDSGSSDGPGGGGGGGIVHLIAPAVTDDGTVAVDGGTAGTVGAPGVALGLKAGGGGGGACGGEGGFGGSVAGNASYGVAGDGVAGHALRTEVDPTALF